MKTGHMGWLWRLALRWKGGGGTLREAGRSQGWNVKGCSGNVLFLVSGEAVRSSSAWKNFQ